MTKSPPRKLGDPGISPEQSSPSTDQGMLTVAASADEAMNQSSMMEGIDLNQLDDDQLERLVLEGRPVHRDTLRNKVFVRNWYGFIGDQLGNQPEEEAKIHISQPPTQKLPQKSLAKIRK